MRLISDDRVTNSIRLKSINSIFFGKLKHCLSVDVLSQKIICSTCFLWSSKKGNSLEYYVEHFCSFSLSLFFSFFFCLCLFECMSQTLTKEMHGKQGNCLNVCLSFWWITVIMYCLSSLSLSFSRTRAHTRLYAQMHMYTHSCTSTHTHTHTLTRFICTVIILIMSRINSHQLDIKNNKKQTSLHLYNVQYLIWHLLKAIACSPLHNLRQMQKLL